MPVAVIGVMNDGGLYSPPTLATHSGFVENGTWNNFQRSVDDIGPEEDVEVIDGDGLFLIPGLTEMHGHLPSPRLSDIDIKNLLFLYLANGVTTARLCRAVIDPGPANPFHSRPSTARPSRSSAGGAWAFRGCSSSPSRHS